MMNDSRRAAADSLEPCALAEYESEAIHGHAAAHRRRRGEMPAEHEPLEHSAWVLLRPRAVMRVLAAIAVALLAVSVLGQVYRKISGDPWLYGLIPQFNVDVENNVPTFFAAMLLAVAALILTFIAREKRGERDRFRWHWAGLALLFWCCSIDEAASFHELLTDPLRKRLNAEGILYFTWVIPGVIIAGGLGAMFWRFLMHLDPSIRRMMFAAAALFLGGALGMEMLGAWWSSVNRESQSLPYAVLATIEEGLEMAGVIVFIGALLTYLGRRRQVVVVRVREDLKNQAMRRQAETFSAR